MIVSFASILKSDSHYTFRGDSVPSTLLFGALGLGYRMALESR